MSDGRAKVDEWRDELCTEQANECEVWETRNFRESTNDIFENWVKGYIIKDPETKETELQSLRFVGWYSDLNFSASGEGVEYVFNFRHVFSRLVGSNNEPVSVNELLTEQVNDPVHRPKHYTDHPSGIECIQITEHMTFCLGNAVKYIWRANLKNESPKQDLEKAIWYLERELEKVK